MAEQPRYPVQQQGRFAQARTAGEQQERATAGSRPTIEPVIELEQGLPATGEGHGSIRGARVVIHETAHLVGEPRSGASQLAVDPAPQIAQAGRYGGWDAGLLQYLPQVSGRDQEAGANVRVLLVLGDQSEQGAGVGTEHRCSTTAGLDPIARACQQTITPIGDIGPDLALDGHQVFCVSLDATVGQKGMASKRDAGIESHGSSRSGERCFQAQDGKIRDGGVRSAHSHQGKPALRIDPRLDRPAPSFTVCERRIHQHCLGRCLWVPAIPGGGVGNHMGAGEYPILRQPTT